MVSGKADPMKLFQGGKLKISGNVMASQKLDFLKKIDRKEFEAALGSAPAVATPCTDVGSRCRSEGAHHHRLPKESHMGRRVNVIGVGMVKFQKPGASDDYNVMAANGSARRWPDAGRGLRAGRAGLRGLRLRRLHLRPAGGLRRRAHGHPGVQREQQLLHGLHRALCSRARPSRAGSPSACSPSASSRWRRARSAPSGHRPHEPPRQARRDHERPAGLQPGPPAAQMFGGAGASTAGSTAPAARPSPRSA
jgi:hypothetical protein